MHLIAQSGKQDGCSPEDRPAGVCIPPQGANHAVFKPNMLWLLLHRDAATLRASCCCATRFACWLRCAGRFAVAAPAKALAGQIAPVWNSDRSAARWWRPRQAETLSLTPAQAAHSFQARCQEDARPQPGCVNACRQPALLTCSDAGAAMQVIDPRSRVGSDSGECAEAEYWEGLDDVIWHRAAPVEGLKGGRIGWRSHHMFVHQSPAWLGASINWRLAWWNPRAEQRRQNED